MARRKKKGVQPRTIVALIQDKSGSMSSRRQTTIEGANEYITTLRKEAEGEVLLTLTQFDTRVTDVFSAKPLTDVKTFTSADYVPGGMTALHDAIGRTVRSTERAERNDDRVLVVVMTDGLENSSREWNKDTILSLIEEKRADGWEFVYLGAGEESWAGGKSLGFTQDQMISYGDLDAHDHKHAVQDVAFASSNVTRQARGSGASYAYLAASPEKTRLEKKAQDERKRTRR